VDITEFVRARLDEDEAAAKLAAREGGTWKQDDPDRHPGAISSLGGPVVYDEGSPDEYQAPHIARHDPARVLREVAAKRAIVERYQRGASGDLPGWTAGRELIEAGLAIVLGVLRDLAAAWSDHPDYRAEWRP
jgi:hypothetical protein